MDKEHINLDEINVDCGGGPPGGHGFRKGKWKATYRGKTYYFFASIPHNASWDGQVSWLKHDAARHIASGRPDYSF
jgi:hypothetical protein